MGLLLGDCFIIMRYSKRKGYVRGEAWRSDVSNMYLVPDNDGGHSEPAVCEDKGSVRNEQGQEVCKTAKQNRHVCRKNQKG